MKTTKNGHVPAAANLGKLVQSDSVRDLLKKHWDVIVLGAGHNGLACAAYLARAGKSVLVLEARERVGGACTLHEVWPGHRISPCAYLAGLLHPLVIEELQMADYGFRWTPATAGMFVPFDDGTSIQLWDDDARCEEEIVRLAPKDLRGWRAFCDVKRRLRDALRPAGDRDIWIGRAPGRDELERRIGDDPEARKVLFEWSMVEYAGAFLVRPQADSGVPRPGRDRHFRQPTRPRNGLDSLSPPVGPAGRHARDVGICRRRNGDGVVHSVRHRPRLGRHRSDRPSGREDHSRRRESSSPAAND